MILITGATGFVGRNLVRRLMQTEYPVRCLLPANRTRRLPWDADAPNAPEIIIGSVLDEESVYQAVTGAHTIIHLESAQWWGRQRDFERLDIAGTRNVIAAARAARVGRIITISQLGASPSSAYMLHRYKGQVEELVRSSGLAYTILRSGLTFGEEDTFINYIALMLRSNPLFYLMPGYGEVVLHPLYVQDLVTCIERSLELVSVVDQTLEVGGPEYTTLQDMLLTIMRVTRMRRLLISVPPYALRWLAQIYGLILPRSLMTPQWLDILAINRTTQLGNTYNYFHFQPRRFEDTLVTYLPKQRHSLKLLRETFRRRPRSV